MFRRWRCGQRMATICSMVLLAKKLSRQSTQAINYATASTVLGRVLLLAILSLLALPARGQQITTAGQASATLANLAKELPAAITASQDILQGRRDANGPSCLPVPAVKSTDRGVPKPPPGDVNGGVGERVLQVGCWDRKPKTPPEDYTYCQTIIRPFMQKLQEQNKPVFDALAARNVEAEQLAVWLAGQKNFPEGFKPVGAPQGTNWPDYCLYQLDQAIGQADLSGCRQWSAELAGATAALLDLHRWLGLLTADHLASLDLQAQCQALFDANPTIESYERSRVSNFPGGGTIVASLGNFFEAQQQGEGYFRKPDEFAKLAGQYHAAPGAAAAVCLRPDVRAAFIELRRHLSADNQSLWDRAANTTFEKSYLTNMLHRLALADTLEPVGVCLERFDRRFPKNAQICQLMDVLDYRASLAMAGIEWADRFDERLMKAGAALNAATPLDALEAARKFQFGVYGGKDNYQNMVLSLRCALDTGHMDCIRATDMIGAVCRDAGWPGFMHVRWDRGPSGHSVAAMESVIGGKHRIDIVDGLFGPGQNKEVWPDSYFKGHDDLYAVELLGRGLDSFVVLETYILRGPNAGKLTKRAVPYLPGHDHAEVLSRGAAARP